MPATKSANVTSNAADDPALSHQEAAKYLGISPKTLSNWKTQGLGPKWFNLPKLPGQKEPSHRYRRSALNAYLESGQPAAASN